MDLMYYFCFYVLIVRAHLSDWQNDPVSLSRGLGDLEPALEQRLFFVHWLNMDTNNTSHIDNLIAIQNNEYKNSGQIGF